MAASASPAPSSRWNLNHYNHERPISLLDFRITDDYGNLVFRAKDQKHGAGRSYEIGLFGNEECTEELLLLTSPSGALRSLSYDVLESTNSRKLGSLRRHGLTS